METSTPPKKRHLKRTIIIVGVIIGLCALIGAISQLTMSPEDKTATQVARMTQTVTQQTVQAEKTAQKEIERATATAESAAKLSQAATLTAAPTNTPEPTNTPKPTNTARPTNTPLPPTATPDPNLVRPGTYIVGTDIQPGIFRGQAGYDLMKSCYWARLKDLSGELAATIANDNSIGLFYVEVAESDYAFKTDCELLFLNSLPEPQSEFPQSIMPGTYLVGIDVQPGTYKGQAGTDITGSCYWGRLRDVSGELKAIIANDNATGQYYVQVQPSDFALSTACELERVGD